MSWTIQCCKCRTRLKQFRLHIHERLKLQVPIKTFAIQAAHTGTAPSTPDDGNDYPTTVEEVQKEAKEAYEKYLKQNTGLGVQDAGKDAVVLDSEETVSELQVG